MNASDYISNDVNPLSPESPISEAKRLFKYLTFTHLPVVKDREYLGLIAEEDIVFQENNSDLLKEYTHLYDTFFATETTNWLDLLKLFATNDSNIIPVLNRDTKYVGYYELNHILHLFYNTPFLNENGVLLVLEKDLKGYSFSEISQIVESNNCNLLGLFVSEIQEEKVQITLKIGFCNVSSISQTFSRYGYQLISDLNDDDVFEELKQRSEYLQKYLNI